MPYLSKTLFIKGLQCHKYLWLEKNRPELKDEQSDSQEALFQSGTDVGMLARDLFPGGVEIPYEGLTHSQQIERTAQAIADGADTLYEAAFSYDGIFMKADILHRDAQGWKLYEVKSSTQMKAVYLNDISVQNYIMNGAGISVNKAYFVHINNQYVRQGEIDVQVLFTMEDITNDVIGNQIFVTEQAAKMRLMLQGDMPVIDIGPYCSDPYDCQFKGTCWQHVPENSVFSIGGRLDRFNLYKQGIIHLGDVPLDILSDRQRLQVEGVLNQKNFINKEAVQEFLSTLRYPLCFLDFETTYMTPVPLYDGTRPYQQVPFQYSAHVIENESSEMQHHEFLAPAGIDPRKPFIESLLAAVPENACVVAYNKNFETQRLQDLKVWFPEHGPRIDGIIENMVDLMVPFRRKDVYLWQMEGSYSIKYVLPALVPELTYDALNISNGEMASSAWLALAQENDPQKSQNIRANLLAYCGLDTLAMVRILEKLKEIVAC